MLPSLKKPKPALPMPTEEQIQDEIMAQAAGLSARLRQEIAHWKQRAEEAEAELNTREFEHRSIADNLRNKIDLLSKQLDETGAKMERYCKQALESATRADNLEMYYITELGRFAEHVDQEANTLVEQANRSANSIINFAKGSAHNLKKFVDELHTKIDPAPPPPVEQIDDGQPIPDFLTKPKSGGEA